MYILGRVDDGKEPKTGGTSDLSDNNIIIELFVPVMYALLEFSPARSSARPPLQPRPVPSIDMSPVPLLAKSVCLWELPAQGGRRTMGDQLGN